MNNTLEYYFHPDNLLLAFHRVVRWPDRLVKDRFGINALNQNLEENLKNLSLKIVSGNYRPQKGFKFYEPKASGTQRTKTLLFIEDALVYQAISNILAKRAYPALSEHDNFIFGSVLNPQTQRGTAILEDDNPVYFFFKHWKSLYVKFKESVIKAIEEDEVTYKFETDITGFFDSIPHYNLLLTLSTEFGVEDEILDILSECFNAWSGTKENSTPGVGIPQGPIPSYFLANLLLHPLDVEVINGANKYYRYMDDIKIYGYSEKELLDILVRIDNYLKGHGLSINSKKTSIIKINRNKEDETVKEFKKLAIMGVQYDGNLDPEDSTLDGESTLDFEDFVKPVSDNLSSMFEHSNQELGHFFSEIISDQKDIIEYWEEEINLVEKDLPALFNPDTLELKNEEETVDIDFIRLSAKYGTALRALNEIKDIEANPILLPYWVFALKKYFWRASNFIITLQYYREDPFLKKDLFELYANGYNYESYRYYILTCLNYNFTYEDRELRTVFKILKLEKSDLVRYACYSLIIRHSKDPQLLSSLKTELSRENTEYLKLIVLDYWKRDSHRMGTMLELIKSVGL